MAQIPLVELIVSVISDNRQALNAAKEVEAAYEKALKGGDVRHNLSHVKLHVTYGRWLFTFSLFNKCFYEVLDSGELR